MDKKRDFGMTSAVLHILAMALMLGDHLWATLFPAAGWLTCLGRIAFPLFAFMIAEGYRRTHDLRRYLGRLLFWAVAAEVPFNLMYSDSPFYPLHQNVLWTFLIALLTIALIEKIRNRFRPVPASILSAGAGLLGFALGYAAMVDYFGVGVLTVLVFHYCRERNWANFLCQLFFLYILHVNILGGFYYSVYIGGFELQIVQQGFALLALIPIWIYKGRQGYHSRAFQLSCYAFYPVHMAVLFLLRTWMLR